MKICVIGAGYVGLVSGTCLAEIGHDVTCVDKNPDKIAKLLDGGVPIFEPGLAELVASNRRAKRLHFTTDLADAVKRGAEFYFIAVETPARAEDGGADLSSVYRAAAEAASCIKTYATDPAHFSVFVTKSTVPVGTSREVARTVGNFLPESSFAVASNPEFLREGAAIDDFMAPDRIVVGSRSERARVMLEELYRPLTRQGRPLVVTTTVETAELIKYAANAFLATKITFVNELSRLCERVGADIEELTRGIGLDNRIGNKFLKAGPGFGGSCFPKDLMALIKIANDFQSPIEIVETVVRVNNRHKAFMVNKVKEVVGNLAGKRIAVLGLAFKANTDDVRESPALTIAPVLERDGAILTAYDPIATENARAALRTTPITFCTSLAEALEGADAALLLTEWDEFHKADWSALASRMASPRLVDLRNIFTLSEARALGIDYFSLGRERVERGAVQT